MTTTTTSVSAAAHERRRPLISETMRALVCGFEPGEVWRFARTERALAAAGVPGTRITSTHAFIAELRAATSPLWLLRAGTWRNFSSPLATIPPSATGLPLIGVGGVLGGARAAAYSCYVEPIAARALAALIERGMPWERAWQRSIKSRRFRAVRLPQLDVHFDPGWRVTQVVTTIQIGGAERVTLDLATELGALRVAVGLVALSRPTRLAFPEPRNFAVLADIPPSADARAAAIAAISREFGADLVHAHLIRGAEAKAIKACGYPLVITVHNLPPGWPAGLADRSTVQADLLLACSRAVGREIEARLPGLPVRVVWNGIGPGLSDPSRGPGTRGERRQSVGWSSGDFVVVSVANLRPQKRLERLPEIISLLAARLAPRAVRLLLVGASAQGNGEAALALAALETALDRWDLRDRTHWTGGVLDVTPWLEAADVFLSVSGWEGLSLALLEALASGLPAVATDVGGASEVAAQTDRLTLVPPDSDAETFAAVLADIARVPAPRIPALPPSFTRSRMALRVRRLYPAALLAAARPHRETLWLITNNFSTGGAQSSARRLLTGLQARGVAVRAVTVEEWPEYPTRGRTKLLARGIDVLSVSPPPKGDSAIAVEEILAEMTAAPPRAVLFWNLIASYKLLLADALLDVPVFDISPGEMFFPALEKFFASPRPGFPYLSATDYGARLAGVVVKYHGEAERARRVLGAPVHVIPNGVPLGGAAASPRTGRLIIGTAARLTPDKRLEELFAAVRLAHPQLPSYQLQIAGGVERDQERYARELRVSARGLPIAWRGELSSPAFLRGLDLFVMISEPAGCPNASLEAMAAGLPVIATDHGGAAEQIIDGLTGRIVPRGDAAAFAGALTALAHDREMRTRFGAAGRARIAEAFSLDQMLDRYAALIESVPERMARSRRLESL